MEIGSHTITHPCFVVPAATMRGEMEWNIKGIVAAIGVPQAQVISLSWPCGIAGLDEQVVAADYFLDARGFNLNQLEDPTPYDFMNLKSFNSHGMDPTSFNPAAPPDATNFCTLVDAAVAQGKWFNLVLHGPEGGANIDDGAVVYALGQNIWIAPLGTVTKYILQRNRTVITNYTESASYIQFGCYRLPLDPSPMRSFETAIGTNDILTFKVGTSGISQVSGVFVNGVQTSFTNSGGVLYFNALVTTNVQTVILDLLPNTAPTLGTQTNRTINELTTMVVTNTATDMDFPAQTLTYALVVTNTLDGSVQTNATIDSNGTISWTPSEAQGPGSYTFITVVTDSGVPALSATNSFTVTVNEVNVAPVLPSQADRTIYWPTLLTVINTATDADIPANPLSYTLTVTNTLNNSVVTNAAIDTNGIITWTPTQAQVPSTNLFTTVVTDTNPAAVNAKSLSATNTFRVIVLAYPLVLPAQTNLTINELTNLVVTNNATVLTNEVGSGWVVTNTIFFNYTNRSALLADGWSFLATNTNGTPRNTETTDPTMVIQYAQTNATLGTVMRVPCGGGDLWSAASNNTTNSIFRVPPTNWISARLNLGFAPTFNYAQTHLVLYQDDDNYVEVGLGFVNAERLLFVQEIAGTPTILASVNVGLSTVWVRLDQDINSGNISAFYSTDGVNWVSMGQIGQSLTNPRLGIWVGASTLPFSTTQLSSDLSQLDILTTNTLDVLTYTLVVTNTADGSVVTNASIDANGLITWTPTQAQGAGLYVFTTIVSDSRIPPFITTNSFTVTVQAPLTVTANNQNRAYGQPNPLLTGILVGLMNNDNITATFTTTAATNSPVGTYPIVPTLNDPNNRLGFYNVTTNIGTLTVTGAVLTATANNASREYGATNPVFTVSYSGFVNGDGTNVLSGAPVLTTSAVTNSPVGAYTITNTIGTLVATNYTVSLGNGSLTVTGAVLTATADNASRAYGATNPVFTVSYSGFVNGDGTNVLFGAPLLTTSAVTNSPVGAYTITNTIGTLVATNYTVSLVNGSLTVTGAVLTATADNASRAYGATNPVFTVSYSGFVNGDGTNVLSGAPVLTTSAVTNSPVGAYTITNTIGTLVATNYTVSLGNGSLTVTGAVLTATANNASRAYGATNPVFTVSYNGFVNGDGTNVLSGAPLLTTSAVTNSPVGAYTITNTIGTLVATNYTVSLGNGSLTVTGAVLTATADNASRAYGATNPVFTVSYSGFVNGDGTNVLSGAPVLTTSAVTNSPVGSYVITNTAGPLVATNYTVSLGNGSLTVTGAVLTATANNASRAYGATNPVFTVSYSGFVNGDGTNVLSGAPLLTTSAMTNSPVGSYVITNTAGPLVATNYTVSLVNGSLTVTGAVLTATANNASRAYGATNPVFTVSYSGFVNGDGTNVLFGAPLLTTSAVTNSPVGAYTITNTIGTLVATNYTVSLVNGSLTVTGAVLTATANNASRAYGATNPVFTVSYSGFVNGDGTNVLSGAPLLTTSAMTNSPVGSYVITNTAGPLVATNYTVSLVNGSLTVTGAVLTATANNASREYGATNPVFTVSYSGFVNGDGTNVLSGAPVLTTSAVTNSPVGAYTITNTIGTLVATNYTVSLVNGSLTVTGAVLTATAEQREPCVRCDQSGVHGQLQRLCEWRWHQCPLRCAGADDQCGDEQPGGCLHDYQHDRDLGGDELHGQPGQRESDGDGSGIDGDGQQCEPCVRGDQSGVHGQLQRLCEWGWHQRALRCAVADDQCGDEQPGGCLHDYQHDRDLGGDELHGQPGQRESDGDGSGIDGNSQQCEPCVRGDQSGVHGQLQRLCEWRWHQCPLRCAGADDQRGNEQPGGCLHDYQHDRDLGGDELHGQPGQRKSDGDGSGIDGNSQQCEP